MDRKNRPIDRIRDGAGQMQVGEPDDNGPITGFFKIDDERHFVLKGDGVYEIVMADGIDPTRLNVQIPNVHQRVMHIGTNDAIVGKTLQLAEILIKKGMLLPEIEIAVAKTFCLEAAKRLAAMRTATNHLIDAETLGLDALTAAKAVQRALALPSVPQLQNRVTGFLQSADHSLQQLLGLVEVFFGADARKTWFESFAGLALLKYGKHDELTQTCDHYLPFLQFVRKARNCVEHEKPTERLIVRDFRMLADGTVAPPTIEIIHPKFSQPETGLSQFMQQVTDGIANVVADLMSAMCAKLLQPQGAFPIAIGPYENPPADKAHIPYRYYIQLKGQWAPLS